ncbi:hypothetical protein SAMN05216464_1132 [Mucilaginibacter pineti]|uniref:Uncharacterized protein n=1 Tax=Mucilaginibacter pineti TaxID=1391627 RepID=A0A1G7IF25_9SPHI|nr:hypothetical protein [Mucilaginibacter pineti]SDF11188.1 hypothetical protein SAMN05216464_1132 [Mucilaginibacter pineti]
MKKKPTGRDDDPATESLASKLQLLAEGGEIELTATEAAVYGADYADQWEADQPGKEDHHG